MGKAKRERKLKAQVETYLQHTGSNVELPEGTSSQLTQIPNLGMIKAADDATNTITINESDNESTRSQSWPEFIEKNILHPTVSFKVVFLTVIVGVCIIFLQDNNSGLLKEWKDILWGLEKCGILSALLLSLFAVFYLLQWVINKFTKQQN